MRLVRDVEESELLALFTPELPVGARTMLGPGDDAAVLAVRGDLVVTTDVLVAERHFRMHWSSGREIGRRAAAQNLADIAAMGAVPTALVVALTLPGDTPVAWVVDLARGLADSCAAHGVGVVGGDLSGGSVVSVAVTALGELTGPAVLRSGARPGDVVAVAGTLGRSAAGLALLSAMDAGVAPPPGCEALLAAYRAPEPPILAGPQAREAGATAMLDVSDGLLRDAGRLALASDVVVDLEERLLAPDVEALAVAAESLGLDPLEWVLTGGEDHALLATFPAGAEPPPSYRRIGRVYAAGAASSRVMVDGAARPGAPGWDHFAG